MSSTVCCVLEKNAQNHVPEKQESTKYWDSLSLSFLIFSVFKLWRIESVSEFVRDCVYMCLCELVYLVTYHMNDRKNRNYIRCNNWIDFILLHYFIMDSLIFLIFIFFLVLMHKGKKKRIRSRYTNDHLHSCLFENTFYILKAMVYRFS